MARMTSFSCPTSRASELEAGGNHSRFVDHQQVAWLQQVRQVADVSMLDGVARHQEASSVARSDRGLRDALVREDVVEVGEPHAGQC